MKNDKMLTMTFCPIDIPDETYAWGVGIHETYVLHHVLSGRGFFETDGKMYSLQKGDSFIIFPGNIVHYYPDPADPWKYTWVNFSGAEVPFLLSMTAFYENPICREDSNLAYIYDHFSRDFRYEHVQQRNDGLLRILLAHYIEAHPRQQKAFTIDNLSLAKNYIETNSHRHRFNVSELAQGIGVERSYLYRLFMDGEGISPSEYITNVRMRKAIQLMKNGVTQVKFISYSVGYTDPLYFSKLFKKKYGMPPVEYMSQKQNENKNENV